jgi:hypothetical protein
MGCNRIIEPLGIVDRRSSTGVMTAGYRTMMPGLFCCIQTGKVNASKSCTDHNDHTNP